MGLTDFLKTKTGEDNGGNGNPESGGVVVPPAPEEKRGRGRPRGSSGAVRTDAIPARPDGPDKALLDELYKSALWAEVAAFPVNIRKIMTGSEVFTLSDTQKQILGSSLAMTMKQFGVIDPKYAALSVLLINFSTIMLELELKYRAEKAFTKDKDKESAKAA